MAGILLNRHVSHTSQAPPCLLIPLPEGVGSGPLAHSFSGQVALLQLLVSIPTPQATQ